MSVRSESLAAHDREIAARREEEAKARALWARAKRADVRRVMGAGLLARYFAVVVEFRTEEEADAFLAALPKHGA